MYPESVPEKTVYDLINDRGKILLAMAGYVSSLQDHSQIMIRPFLGEFLSQSMQMEELLDAYGARKNCRWCLFRAMVAVIKLFSDVSYEIMHIQHSLPAYHLLPIKDDFETSTALVLNFTEGVLVAASKKIVELADEIGLQIPGDCPDHVFRTENLPTGRLENKCTLRKVDDVGDAVTLLATAFLNLADKSRVIHVAGRAKPQDYASFACGSITEDKLRAMELQFHNLQSLYDTYVSESKIAVVDADLPVLRGHISVVFHLLKVATELSHHYERHVNIKSCPTMPDRVPLVDSEQLLSTLMNYSINFASQYLNCAQKLCQDMLKRYAQVGRIEVSVPPYRGFHVRPSTLVSKIVLHYGSAVNAQFDGDVYDAGSALELFRVNEKINSYKRKGLFDEIMRLKLVAETGSVDDIGAMIMGMILTLAGQGRLILYEQPLLFSDILPNREGTLLEVVREEIAWLFATGKIDVETDAMISFTGDKRVLADISLLADCGYGEDNFGNNISLPESLNYLRY